MGSRDRWWMDSLNLDGTNVVRCSSCLRHVIEASYMETKNSQSTKIIFSISYFVVLNFLIITTIFFKPIRLPMHSSLSSFFLSSPSSSFPSRAYQLSDDYRSKTPPEWLSWPQHKMISRRFGVYIISRALTKTLNADTTIPQL